jgi:hypothetical protein
VIKRHLFNGLIAIALVILVALTVREAFATTVIVSSPDTGIACNSLPSHLSLHTEVAKEAGARWTYTEDGPTGVDGGLIQLLSSYRTCSR